MNKLSIPGIRKVGWLYADSLTAQIEKKATAGLLISVVNEINYIYCWDIQMEISNDYDNGGRLEEVTLKFSTLDSFPKEINRIAWIAIDNNGAVWLIGKKEKPYPICKVTYNSGTAGSKSAVAEVEISLYGRKAAVGVVIPKI